MKLVQFIIFGGIFLKSELAQKLKMINLGIRPSYEAVRFMEIVMTHVSDSSVSEMFSNSF